MTQRNAHVTTVSLSNPLLAACIALHDKTILHQHYKEKSMNPPRNLELLSPTFSLCFLFHHGSHIVFLQITSNCTNSTQVHPLSIENIPFCLSTITPSLHSAFCNLSTPLRFSPFVFLSRHLQFIIVYPLILFARYLTTHTITKPYIDRSFVLGFPWLWLQNLSKEEGTYSHA
jgi:hypothetical protein